MLSAALAQPGAAAKTGGFAFREVLDPGFAPRADIAVRAATAADIGNILAVHDGFFDDRAEIESYLAPGARLFLFYESGTLAGCGIAKRIVPGRSDFDIGMVVAPAHRNKGLGAYIVGWLKDHCLAAGFRPVAGCHAGNTASRRALERAGFADRHRIFEVCW